MYEDRIVAFVDFLGFKNMVADSINDQKIFNNIKIGICLNEFLKMRNYKKDKFLSECDMGKEISFFSDCMVISYGSKHPAPLFYALLDLVHHCLNLANNNILVRGGITYGKLYHKENICFGPAMNEAYRLESDASCAKYPRIIIDEELFKNVDIFKADMNSVEDEMESINLLIKKDRDGYYFLDYLSQHQEWDLDVGYPNIYYDLLLKVKYNIESNLAKYASNKRILRKYNWYKRYYNDVIRRVFGKGQKQNFKIK